MTEPYRVIAADPPWAPTDRLPGKSRGAARNYQVMSVDDLCHFELPSVANDSVLFMWRLSSMQPEALRLVSAWGFRLHSEIVWHKLTKTGTKTHFGMGRIVRGAHETCLICVRGKPKIRSKSVRSIFSAPVGRHSEKPGLFYTLVEELCDGPRVELFARKHRPGWTCLGKELPSNDTEAAE